ncbi:MAG: ribosomal RNA small subunit methyltransferase A [Chloroflexi bacterium]|nr:ribosomal RNA small subunit methyltransferase A [Chloroflexota bacterium]
MASTEAGDAPGALLRGHGLSPRKRLGQHFLRDRSFLRTILRAADVGPSDEVLEIGAGTGVLTRPLVEHARRVVAVELDDALYHLLAQQLGAMAGLELWHGNALALDPCRLFGGTYKLVGNIPYYVTGPILRHFLEAACPPSVLVLMVQREVAERMVAPPGDLSLLGVSVQFYALPEIVARVPARAFHPAPRVESAIVRLLPHPPRLSDRDRALFFAIVRAGFSTRRKQLANALSNGLGLPKETVRSLLGRAGIAETRRAETLSVDEWLTLTRHWTEGQERP